MKIISGILFILLVGCTGSQPPAQTNNTTIIINNGADGGTGASSSSSSGNMASSSSSSSSGAMTSSGGQGDAGAPCTEALQCGPTQVCGNCVGINSIDAGPCSCTDIATSFCESGACVANSFARDVTANVFADLVTTHPLSVRVTVLDAKVGWLCAGDVPCSDLRCTDITSTDASYSRYNVINSTVFSMATQGPVHGSTTKYETSIFVLKQKQLMVVDGRTLELGQGAATGHACQEFDTTNFNPDTSQLVINTTM